MPSWRAVGSEESALETELRLVQARLAKAARRVEDEEGNVSKLRQQLQAEQARLLQQQKSLESARKEAVQVTTRKTLTEQAKSKLVAELLQLEQSLKDLQEARKRDANTWSVIPYFGKNGESRRPLYVECAAVGVLFHPDKLQLDGSSIRPGSETNCSAERPSRAGSWRPEGRKTLVPM